MVIPAWNRAALLRKLLDTLSLQTLQPERVIVADNGSTDDVALVAHEWGAEVVSMGANLGFAAAVNRGIAAAGTPWVAVVNTDVELRPDWLERLIRAAVAAGAWFAAGKILMASDPSRLDGTWDLVSLGACPWRAGHGQPDSPTFSQPRPIAFVPATAALYRRELFDRVGVFAVRFESYLEDVEFSLRCAAADLGGVYEPSAVCLHQGSASSRAGRASGAWSARVTYLNSRNQAMLAASFPAEFRSRFRWKIWIGQGLWGLLALRHGRFLAWLRGKRDAPRDLAPVFEARRLEQVLTRSEREIRTLQSEGRGSLYWRLYFLITGSES